MGRRSEYVINGHLVEVENRRTPEDGLHVECLVYPGPTSAVEPEAEWVMPHTFRYDHELAAQIAERQTGFPKN